VWHFVFKSIQTDKTMQTHTLRPAPTAAHPSPDVSSRHTAPAPRATVYILYPHLYPFHCHEAAILRACKVLDAHGCSSLADELCASFNNLPF
jgi:hypothetical protein